MLMRKNVSEIQTMRRKLERMKDVIRCGAYFSKYQRETIEDVTARRAALITLIEHVESLLSTIAAEDLYPAEDLSEQVARLLSRGSESTGDETDSNPLPSE